MARFQLIQFNVQGFHDGNFTTPATHESNNELDLSEFINDNESSVSIQDRTNEHHVPRFKDDINPSAVIHGAKDNCDIEGLNDKDSYFTTLEEVLDELDIPRVIEEKVANSKVNLPYSRVKLLQKMVMSTGHSDIESCPCGDNSIYQCSTTESSILQEHMFPEVCDQPSMISVSEAKNTRNNLQTEKIQTMNINSNQQESVSEPNKISEIKEEAPSGSAFDD